MCKAKRFEMLQEGKCTTMSEGRPDQRRESTRGESKLTFDVDADVDVNVEMKDSHDGGSGLLLLLLPLSPFSFLLRCS